MSGRYPYGPASGPDPAVRWVWWFIIGAVIVAAAVHNIVEALS